MPRENCLYFRLQLNIEIHGYLAMLELPVGLPINYNLIFRKEREKGKKEKKNKMKNNRVNYFIGNALN